MIITGGKYKGQKIILPDEKIVRPTLSQARESVFSSLFSIMSFKDEYKQEVYQYSGSPFFWGKSFLDTFSGSGIMGLEALSRGFERVVAIEKNPKVAKILKENYLKLKIEPNLIIGDALKKINDFNEEFDVIYLDPPYLSSIYGQILQKIQENNLLKKNGVIVLEHSLEISRQDCGFKLIRQKKYSGKFITYLTEK